MGTHHPYPLSCVQQHKYLPTLSTCGIIISHIGTADFVPDVVGYSEEGGKMRCETLTQTLEKASDWINKQQGIRVTNVQTINYKTKRK